MADLKLSYPAASDLTITLASLASDTSLLTGRESAVIDNTANLYLDFLISGKITAGTSPTAARSIEVWAVGSWDGTNWPDVFDGTESAETITSADIKRASAASWPRWQRQTPATAPTTLGRCRSRRRSVERYRRRSFCS